MSTFNAGAVEAKLTLDRTPFQRSLKAAQAEARKISNMKITPELVIKGKEKLAELKKMIDSLDGKNVNLDVKIAGEEKIAALSASIEKLDGKNVDLDVKITGEEKIAAVKGLIDSLDGKNIAIKVSVVGLARLTKLAAAIEAINAQDINIKVDVNGEAELAQLETIVRSISGQNLDFQVKIDGEGKIVELAAAASALSGKNITFEVDVDGAWKLGVLAAEAEALDGKNINFDTSGAIGGLSRMQAIVVAIIALLPLLSPLVATLGASLVGLAAGLTGALGGLAVVGAAVGPTVQNMMAANQELSKAKTKLEALTPGTKAYITQQEKIKNLQDSLVKKYGEASVGLVKLKDAWDSWQKVVRPEAQKLVGGAFETLAAIIPKLTPIFKAFAPVITGMFTAIQNFVKGPEMARLVNFFAGFGADALDKFLKIGGNLILFFGRLFEAFAPFATTLLDGIVKVTGAWADWANNLGDTKGFSDFMAYVREVGPVVWDFLTNMVGAIIAIGRAMAPVGDILLKAFTGFFMIIQDMPPELLGAIVTGITGIAVAFGVVSAAMAILSVNPVVLIIAAVVGLVSAILYLWNTSDGFRNAIIAIFSAIGDAAIAVKDWFVSAFQAIGTAVQNAGALFAGIGTAIITVFTSMVQRVGQFFVDLWNVISVVLTAIWATVVARWNSIVASVTGAVSAIGNAVSVGFNFVRNLVMSIIGTVANFITERWNAIRAIVSSAVSAVSSAVSNAFNAVRNTVVSIFSAVSSFISTTVNTIRNTVTSAFNAVVTAISGALSRALGVVRGIVGSIKGVFSGAGSWLVDSGRKIIGGLIDGIKSMIGAVKDAVGGVLSKARDLLPFSPAKEGPFSGRGWTLYSGKSITLALAEGMLSEVDKARAAAQALADSAVPNLDLTPRISGVKVGTSATPTGATENPGQGTTAPPPSIITPAAAPASITKNINHYLTINNPVPEPASRSLEKAYAKTAYLGLDGGE